MNTQPFISILVAEDNDVSRQLITGILENKGYQVWGAIDGESAIKVIEERDIQLALVDVNMAPTGGLEFIKYVITKGKDIPCVLVTGDSSSDLLITASSLGVAKVLQKPVDPDRLSHTVERILKRRGYNPAPLSVSEHNTQHSPEELMRKTITLASENMRSGKGRPFAAIVASADGEVLGKGANGHASRIDPTAHAEVMAIRNAAEKLGQKDLKGCTLYCSSRPTKIGEALIESVEIQEVYYGLDPSDLKNKPKATQAPQYTQICKDEALKLFES